MPVAGLAGGARQKALASLAGSARFRVSLGLKLPDAVQVASAIAVNADALVTRDRDLSWVKASRVLS